MNLKNRLATFCGNFFEDSENKKKIKKSTP